MRILAIFAMGTLLLSSAAYAQGRAEGPAGEPNRDSDTDVGEPLTRGTETDPDKDTLELQSWSVNGPGHTVEPASPGPDRQIEMITILGRTGAD